MSIQLYGRQIDVPNTACPLDPAEVVRAVTRGKGSRVPRSTEGYKRNPRTSWISGHVTHTSSQLDAYVRLCDELSYHAGIPRVIPWRDGKPFLGMLTRALAAHGSGKSLCCFYAHCNVWTISKKTRKLVPVRSEGDPSRLPFEALKAAGYLALDVEKGEDLELFKGLQARFGLEPDGVWGPASRLAYLRSDPGSGGMLVKRPGDELRGVPAWVRARGVAL